MKEVLDNPYFTRAKSTRPAIKWIDQEKEKNIHPALSRITESGLSIDKQIDTFQLSGIGIMKQIGCYTHLAVNKARNQSYNPELCFNLYLEQEFPKGQI